MSTKQIKRSKLPNPNLNAMQAPIDSNDSSDVLEGVELAAVSSAVSTNRDSFIVRGSEDDIVTKGNDEDDVIENAVSDDDLGGVNQIEGRGFPEDDMDILEDIYNDYATPQGNDDNNNNDDEDEKRLVDVETQNGNELIEELHDEDEDVLGADFETLGNE